MKKIIKIFCYSTLSILAVLIIISVVGYFLIDLNDFKDNITKEIKAKTGRDIVISGDIQKSIYPTLGINIGGIKVLSPTGFKNKVFVKVDNIDIGVKLIPILSGNIEANTVTLKGVNVHLEKNKNGVTNWQFAINNSPVDKKPNDNSASDSMADVNLTFQGIEVINAKFSYLDQISGKDIQVSDLNFISKIEALDEPFSINLSAKLENNNPQLKADIDFKVIVQLDKEFTRLSLSDFELAIIGQSELLPIDDDMQMLIKSDIDVDLKEMNVNIQDLLINTMDIELKGELTANSLLVKPQISSKITVSSFSPKSILDKLKIQLPEMKNPNALSKAELDIIIDGNLAKLNVTKLKVSIDDTVVDGTALVTNVLDPAIEFNIDINKVNLDDYLPPPLDKTAENQIQSDQLIAGAEQNEMAEEKIDFTVIRQLKINGQITVGEVIANNLKTTDVKVIVKVKDGVVGIAPFTANLYQGSVEVISNVDFTGDTPKIKVEKKLSNFKAAPFTKDLLGKERISGIANITINSSTEGITKESILNNLNGKVAFSFADGAISGINIAQLIRNAKAKIQGKEIAGDENQQTDFSEIGGTALINNGVINNNDLNAMSPLFRITGQGMVDLPASKVDYTTVVSIVDTSKGQGGKSLEDLNRIPIPLRFKGDLTDPKIKLDLKAALTAKQKQLVADKKAKLKKEAKESVEKEKEKVKEKLKDKLGGKFKGLFK